MRVEYAHTFFGRSVWVICAFLIGCGAQGGSSSGPSTDTGGRDLGCDATCPSYVAKDPSKDSIQEFCTLANGINAHGEPVCTNNCKLINSCKSAQCTDERFPYRTSCVCSNSGTPGDPASLVQACSNPVVDVNPPGPYQATCTACGKTQVGLPQKLSCSCPYQNRWRRSEIPLPCASEIINCKGVLTCGACQDEWLDGFYRRSGSAETLYLYPDRKWCRLRSTEHLAAYGSPNVNHVPAGADLGRLRESSGDCSWPNGFYLEANNDRLYWLYGGNNWCRVANMEQLPHLGGSADQIRNVPAHSALGISRSWDGTCRWPDGIYKEPEPDLRVYRMYETTKWCHITNEAQLDAMGGPSKIVHVPKDSDLGAGRGYQRGCVYP